MGTTVVFGLGVLVLVAYALYECTAFSHHDNPYRDGLTGNGPESRRR
jgi:hypothetical protein